MPSPPPPPPPPPHLPPPHPPTPSQLITRAKTYGPPPPPPNLHLPSFCFNAKPLVSVTRENKRGSPPPTKPSFLEKRGLYEVVSGPHDTARHAARWGGLEEGDRVSVNFERNEKLVRG